MTIVCPGCKTKNLPGRLQCLGCGSDLTALQPTDEEVRLAAPPEPADVVAAGHSAQTQSLAEQVAGWYRIYCVATLLIGILATLFLVISATARQPDAFSNFPNAGMPADIRGILEQSSQQFKKQEDEKRAGKTTVILLIMVPLLILYAAAAFQKPSPGTWGLGVLVLCLGLGGCSLPFAVILLIHWFKPEVREYFDRGGT